MRTRPGLIPEPVLRPGTDMGCITLWVGAQQHPWPPPTRCQQHPFPWTTGMAPEQGWVSWGEGSPNRPRLKTVVLEILTSRVRGEDPSIIF